MNISEKDWKLLRTLHEVALQRFCERALHEFREVSGDRTYTAHERFLRLFELVATRNRDLAHAFDDLRRSTALQRLVAMRGLGVVTDEDLSPFSPETRTAVARLEGAL